VRARWIRLGRLSPDTFYASAQAVAECLAEGAPPVVLWGRCERGHLCVGAGQDAAAELDLDACRRRGLAVFRRPLGGGTVFVDPWQWCFFLVVPRTAAIQPRFRFLAQCLTPAAATFAGFGIAAKPAGGADLWVEGRKILGSGAASIGVAQVWGASFLLRFDAAAFAAVVRAPHAGFRDWLREELEAGMTDWARQGALPDPDDLEVRFRREVAIAFGWRVADSELSAAERGAIPAAREELADAPGGGGRRRVCGGIKIRHRAYLVERSGAGGTIRLVLRDGRIVRVGWWPAGGGVGGGELRGAWALRPGPLAAVLRGVLGTETATAVAGAAARLAARILEEADDGPTDN
jgi:lipoate-protein ligase A